MNDSNSKMPSKKKNTNKKNTGPASQPAPDQHQELKTGADERDPHEGREMPDNQGSQATGASRVVPERVVEALTHYSSRVEASAYIRSSSEHHLELTIEMLEDVKVRERAVKPLLLKARQDRSRLLQETVNNQDAKQVDALKARGEALKLAETAVQREIAEADDKRALGDRAFREHRRKRVSVRGRRRIAGAAR